MCRGVFGVVEQAGVRQGFDKMKGLASSLILNPEWQACISMLSCEYDFDFASFVRPEFRLFWLLVNEIRSRVSTQTQESHLKAEMATAVVSVEAQDALRALDAMNADEDEPDKEEPAVLVSVEQEDDGISRVL
jgi:hypothetical protein